MNKLLHLTTFFFFISVSVCLGQAYELSFESHHGSTGEQLPLQKVEMPQTEIVYLNNNMNSKSGIGPTMNFHGNVVVLEYMNGLPDGSIQISIRREDGKKFFGHLESLKAILRPINGITENRNLVLNQYR